MALARACRTVHVSSAVEAYIVALVRASRAHQGVLLGASPRGSLALYRAAQSLAAIRGRDYVLPDDVQALSGPTLSHRLIATSQYRVRGRAVADILAEIIGSVPVPVEERWSAHGE